MIFVPDNQATEVLKPREETFDFPASPVATQWTTVLRDGLASATAMWSDHLDASFFGEASVQSVTVVGLVPNEPLGKLVHEARVQGRLDESHFMRASAGCVNGER